MFLILFFRYRSRFRLPYDLLYYRYNLYRQQSGGAKTGTDVIFDPIGKKKSPKNVVLVP